jgi:hypothetical protein
MKKDKHGGTRKGSGRKPGSGTKAPTVVIRIPLAIKPQVDKLIEKHKKKGNN